MKVKEVTRVEVNCEPQEIDVLYECKAFLDNLLEEMSNRRFELAFCEFEGNGRDFSTKEIAEIKDKLEWLECLQEFH